MILERILRSNFEALSMGDVKAIMRTWAAAGVYDNPMVGSVATGRQEVEARMRTLAERLAAQGTRLTVDRVTEVLDRAFVEWHAEPDGSRGVHVVEFDDTPLITRITVYPRPERA